MIVWFRQDLRLFDNPALHAALETHAPIIPLYILDDIAPGRWKMGAASRVWLHHSLTALDTSLGGGRMVYAQGAATDILPQLVKQFGARGVFWNRQYEPWAIARDTAIKETLQKSGLEAKSFNANLLFEPWTITKDDGTPYRVFTPFWRKGCANRINSSGVNACQNSPSPSQGEGGVGDRRFSLPPTRLAALGDLPLKGGGASTDLSSLSLLPTTPRWDQSMINHWTPGELGATARFHTFLDHGLRGYKEDRNRPDLENVSRLSPHLHFGEISVRQIYHTVTNAMAADPSLTKDADHFLSELGWREFSNHLLYHNPTLPTEPLQPAFKNFPWRNDDAALERWQRGQTGVPMVDAGMRELYATGYMHNRVRMIVGSYLVKNLLLHWTHGEDWFWDTLVDADLANNAASWQWIAGCGADAAPYYRIFNPGLQAEKFDPDGVYIKRWVPEAFPPPPEGGRAGVGVSNYPSPIIDHASARDRALAAYGAIKR
jgi:deoxyribodipyrimidine photo-lyase